jgi:hypothetical protein
MSFEKYDACYAGSVASITLQHYLHSQSRLSIFVIIKPRRKTLWL